MKLLISIPSLLLYFIGCCTFVNAQLCETNLTIELKNTKGGYHTNKTVQAINTRDGNTITAVSDALGLASMRLPCNSTFELIISNYSTKEKISSPTKANTITNLSFSYSDEMVEKSKKYALNDVERKVLDQKLMLLPDTIHVTSGRMNRPADFSNYTHLTILLTNLERAPLTGEKVIITGEKRKKTITAITNERGEIQIYLPKGDFYTIGFRYQPIFATEDVLYMHGTSTSAMRLQYIGTAEIERRKKIEDERLKAAERKASLDRKEFEDWCKKEKITHEEGYRRRLKPEERASNGSSERIISQVLNRNKWSDKLIVCDLTGSMMPYAQELTIWYQLNFLKEKNLQFVFFNDGNQTPDDKKVIGSTGGIYYQKSTDLKSLVHLMSKVQSNGDGGDGPENDLEALIKGVDLAGPYKELILIADSQSSVKDITLLKKFNRPVHVLLCGQESDEILSDYLLIAWKTKGSIHTIEEDILKIAELSEGQTLKISGYSYKIMGGQFIRL